MVPVVVVFATVPAGAQERGRQPVIPRSAAPPAGMCRIWLKDVAPAQQPAPTDCAAAIRARPQDALVLFGGVPESDRAPSGSSRAAAPLQPGQLSSDPITRMREVERRAMYEATLRNSMQPRGVTARVVTELPPKSGATVPVVVREPTSKTP